MNADVLYTRIRNVLIKNWNMTPWQFDEAVNEGKVSMSDVMNAIELLSYDVANFAYMNYIFKEQYEEKRQNKIIEKQNSDFIAMLSLAQPANDEAKEKKERLIQEHRGGS